MKTKIIIFVLLFLSCNIVCYSDEIKTSTNVSPDMNTINWGDKITIGVDTTLKATFTPKDKRKFKKDTASAAPIGTFAWSRTRDLPQEIIFTNSLKLTDEKRYPTNFSGEFITSPGKGDKPLNVWLATGSIAAEGHSYFNVTQESLDNVTDSGVQFNGSSNQSNWNYKYGNFVTISIPIVKGNTMQNVTAAIRAVMSGKTGGTDAYGYCHTNRGEAQQEPQENGPTKMKCLAENAGDCEEMERLELRWIIKCSITSEIVLPKWNEYDSDKSIINNGAINQWENLLSLVDTHEKRHFDAYKKYARKLQTIEKRKYIIDACHTDRDINSFVTGLSNAVVREIELAIEELQSENMQIDKEDTQRINNAINNMKAPLPK